MSILRSIWGLISHKADKCPMPSTSELSKPGNKILYLLQQDYDVLLDYLKTENGWSQERAAEFTQLVNHVLNGPYREQVINLITETASNIRISQNETTLAMIKVRQK